MLVLEKTDEMLVTNPNNTPFYVTYAETTFFSLYNGELEKSLTLPPPIPVLTKTHLKSPRKIARIPIGIKLAKLK